MSDKPNASLEDYSPEELAAMGKLYADLAKNPETREVVLRATKKVSPTTSIPEIELMDKVNAATKPLLDELTTRRAKDVENEQKERLRAARAELLDAGHSKQELEEIEKLMLEQKKEGNLLSHKGAAEFYKLQKQTAQPTPSGLRVNTLPWSGKDVKAAGGVRKYGAIEAQKAIDDLKAGRVKFH